MSSFTRIMLIIAVMLQCVGVFDHTLWTPDEPRVAEIAREMSISGNYLIPHHSRQPFLEHPPMYYAMAAIGFSLLGTGNEGNGRMASAFFSILTLLVVFTGVRRLYPGETAALSVAILSSSFLFFQVAHKMLVDSALGFSITLALFGFLLGYKGQWRHGFKLFWIGMAVAFLSKGLIGIAIPGVVVSVFILWQGDLTVIRRIWAIPGTLLLLGVVGLWTGILYQAGGNDFLRTFYIYNQIGRFFQSVIYTGGHFRPFYYYLGNFWGDGAPWSLLMIPFVIRVRQMDDAKRFFCAWFLGGIILLSLASTKRDLYLLPLMPAMAVMVASWMSELAGRVPETWEHAVLYILGGIFLVCSVAVPFGYVRFLGGPWSIGMAVLSASVVAAWFIYHYCKPNLPSMLTMYWCVLLLLWIPVLFPQIDQHKSYKDLFVQIGKTVAGGPVAGYQLTETVEALALYYGGFYVDNIEDRRTFEHFIAHKHTAYAVVLPSRLDAGLQTQLQRYGIPLIKDTTRMRKEIELWKIDN